MAKANLKRDWQPDKAAFDRLLAWLDEGTESRGERYLEIRERLVDYFGRRDCLFPEDLADETLNRVARRLEETGSIDDVVPARYCYIVAKFVFLESLRRPGQVELVTQSAEAVVAQMTNERADSERTLNCLEQCLQSCSSRRSHPDPGLLPDDERHCAGESEAACANVGDYCEFFGHSRLPHSKPAGGMRPCLRRRRDISAEFALI